MSMFNLLGFGKKPSGFPMHGAIDYGRQKRDGSHDHRYNTGSDRTPAQKARDKKPGKTKSD